MKPLKIYSFCFLLLLPSCFLRGNPFSTAKKLFSEGLCKESLQAFQKTTDKKKKHKKFAYLAARECLKKYKEPESSFLFYKVLLNEDLKKDSFLRFKEKKEIELKMAHLAFYELRNYKTAIKYYKEKLKFVPKPHEKFNIQYQMANSFFLLNKYDQSLEEIKKILLEKIRPYEKQKTKVLKGRNLIAKKKFDEAIPFFEQLIVAYPKKESFFREYLVLIYEEKKEFQAAIREVEKIQPPSSFTRQKIQSLYERLKNQPGVRL